MGADRKDIVGEPEGIARTPNINSPTWERISGEASENHRGVPAEGLEWFEEAILA